MKRSPAQRPTASPPSTAKAHPSRLRWVVTLALLLGVGLVSAVVFWPRSGGNELKLPALDLSRVDAPSRATIEKHLDAVKSQPKSGPAWGQLGAVLRAYDYSSAARACLAQAERLDPGNPRWPYFQALLRTVDTPAEAIVKLRQTVRLCGNDPEAPRLLLARLLGEQGRWDEARQETRLLLQARPGFAPALLLEAHAAQAAGQWAEAIAAGRLCTDDPRTARSAWALLAGVYARQGAAAAAAGAGQRAARLPADARVADPFESEAAMLRGDPREIGLATHPLLAAGRLDDAARLIDRLAREHPQTPETWLLLGRYRFLRKDLPGAEAALRRHLELDARSTQGLFQLGMVLLNLERFEEAAETFHQATKIKPDFGPAFYNRGLALTRRGQFSEAASAFRETIRHNPEHIDSYFMLADMLFKLSDEAEARKVLEQARVLNPTHPRWSRGPAPTEAPPAQAR
jgi:tetratricopeptide (TPR) repeat protein